MRVCKIWDADYPWDIRVEKICDSLIQHGHEVALICRNEQRRQYEEKQGALTIFRLPAVPPILGEFNRIASFPLPINPIWIFRIFDVLRRVRPSVVLVRDILLAVPCGLIAKAMRVPVVLDMAENYPAMLDDRLKYTPTSSVGRLVRSPSLARRVESSSLRLMSHVIVVVEESRERLIQGGYPRERISIVENTPTLGRWQRKRDRERGSRRGGGALQVAYLGILDGSRGIDTALVAVQILSQQGRSVRLVVIGDGPNRDVFEKMAEELGVSNSVEFRGRASFGEVQATMDQSDVGIIPTYSTPAWNTTMPNKLFDYMACGLPVVVSNTKPMARVVREVGCGEVFGDRNPEELAVCLERLMDPAVRVEMGTRGFDAIVTRYNWERDSSELLSALGRVVERSQP